MKNVTGVQMSANVPPPPFKHPQARILRVPAIKVRSDRHCACCCTGSCVCRRRYWFHGRRESERHPSASLYPAIHIAATALLFTPPANSPMPITIVVPFCGASNMAFGDPTPLKTSGIVREIQLRRAWVQSDEHSIRAKL